jgi:hypothetical protein
MRVVRNASATTSQRFMSIKGALVSRDAKCALHHTSFQPNGGSPCKSPKLCTAPWPASPLQWRPNAAPDAIPLTSSRTALPARPVACEASGSEKGTVSELSLNSDRYVASFMAVPLIMTAAAGLAVHRDKRRRIALTHRRPRLDRAANSPGSTRFNRMRSALVWDRLMTGQQSAQKGRLS